MNERLQELALQARLRPALLLKYWGTIDAFTSSEQEELEQLEKFAELIVQECISILEQAENGYKDYRNQIEDSMRNHCIDLIKNTLKEQK